MNIGVPFTSRPKAVRYDYKVKMSGEPHRIRQTGFSRKSTVEGQDCAIMTCLLQKRTEDKDGNIIAKRVGTAVVRYDKNSDWHNGATYEIHYGDISHTAYYDAELMRIIQFTSSLGGAYVGSPGNTIWVDNVCLVYE